MNQNQKFINAILLYFCQPGEYEVDLANFLKENEVIKDTQQASDKFSDWLSKFDVTKNVT